MELAISKVGTLVESRVPLFASYKAYILIGGMSDVGIHVATWMYKVCSNICLLDPTTY